MDELAWLDRYLREKPATVWDYKIEWGWDRYRVAGKLYAAICLPGPAYAKEYAGHPLLTLKCDPAESELLRAGCPDILPGFYTDKRRWISTIRPIRAELKQLRDEGKITPSVYRMYYRKAKGGVYKSRRNLRMHMVNAGYLKEEE